MKTYNTYQEAKIANPKSEIYVSTDGQFATEECTIMVALTKTKGEWYKWSECHPKDYCMTLAEFLAKGHRLVEGDVFIGASGAASKVADEIGMNIPDSQDKDRYILRAKALEQAEFDTTPQQVESLASGEWNGEGLPPAGAEVECKFCNDSETKWDSAKVLFSIGSVGVVEINSEQFAFSIGHKDNQHYAEFRKPETPQQRQEREEFEAAYKLYCIGCKAAGDIPTDRCKFKKIGLKDRYLAIARETKYRKEAK